MRRLLSSLLSLLAFIVAPAAVPAASAAAQISVRVDAGVGFLTAYVDRGVMLTNTPVLQPSLAVRMPLAGGFVTLGGTATLEPASYTDPKYFGLTQTTKRPDLSEARPSLRLTQPFAKGAVVVDVGGEYRMYPNSVGVTKDANTASVITSLTFAHAPLAPSVAFVYEVGAVNGASLDLRLDQRTTVATGVRVRIGARAGVGLTRSLDAAPAAFAAYGQNGFTYAEMSGGLDLTVAGATLAPTVTLSYVPDPLVAAPQRQRETMVTFGVTLGGGGTFPRPKS